MALSKKALVVLALATAIAWNYVSLWPWVSRVDSDFDAIHLYFPLANELIANGYRFFAEERSLQAPPFAYAWPAIFGPSLERVKVVNFALSGVSLILLFRLGWLLHSLKAGVIAAALFAASPLLHPHLATAVTEPPFILLTVVWAWAIAEALDRPHILRFALSGVAFALAALTRASLFYLAPVLVVIFFVWALRTNGEFRRMLIRAAGAHVLAIAIVGVFILRGVAFFGFPYFSTGAGNALFLGTNPLTGGYDSNYLGLIYDVGAVVQQPSHLTLSADSLLKRVALRNISEWPAFALIQILVQKAAAFLFVTNAEPDVELLRAWRIVLIVLSAAGAYAVRMSAMRLLLVATLAYQLLVHVPVLYTHRYSVGAIDPWLIVLAAIGTAALWGRWRAAILVFALVTAAVAAGMWMALGPLPEPDVYRAARLTIWELKPASMSLEVSRPIDIEISEAANFNALGNHVLVIEGELIASEEQPCDALQVSFRGAGHEQVVKVVRQRHIERGKQRHQFGGAALGLSHGGTVQLELNCLSQSNFRVTRLAVVQPWGSLDGRERVLGEPPRFAYER